MIAASCCRLSHAKFYTLSAHLLTFIGLLVDSRDEAM